MPIKPVIDIKRLHERVQKYVIKDNMSYTEAIIEVCEQLDIEPQDMAKIIKGPLKDKLAAEAQDRNIIKSKTAKLL
jgi:hypothetical protein